MTELAIDHVKKTIRVSGVVIFDSEGRLLTVRKRNTDRFMLPGGKPEPGESALSAAIRECEEELGLKINSQNIRLLGQFDAPAANEDGYKVESTIFVLNGQDISQDEIEPAAEIEQLRWMEIEANSLPSDLAPLLSSKVIPALLG